MTNETETTRKPRRAVTPEAAEAWRENGKKGGRPPTGSGAIKITVAATTADTYEQLPDDKRREVRDRARIEIEKAVAAALVF